MCRRKPTPDELLTVIREKCMDCSGGSRKMVERCEVRNCPLYPYRSRQAMGAAGDGRGPVKGQIDLFEMMGKTEEA